MGIFPRGGSSPLERMRKALLGGAFLRWVSWLKFGKRRGRRSRRSPGASSDAASRIAASQRAAQTRRMLFGGGVSAKAGAAAASVALFTAGATGILESRSRSGRPEHAGRPAMRAERARPSHVRSARGRQSVASRQDPGVAEDGRRKARRHAAAAARAAARPMPVTVWAVDARLSAAPPVGPPEPHAQKEFGIERP